MPSLSVNCTIALLKALPNLLRSAQVLTLKHSMLKANPQECRQLLPNIFHSALVSAHWQCLNENTLGWITAMQRCDAVKE